MFLLCQSVSVFTDDDLELPLSLPNKRQRYLPSGKTDCTTQPTTNSNYPTQSVPSPPSSFLRENDSKGISARSLIPRSTRPSSEPKPLCGWTHFFGKDRKWDHGDTRVQGVDGLLLECPDITLFIECVPGISHLPVSNLNWGPQN